MEKNKVVIISGGTSGIGLATAKILVSEGWKTILLGRDMSKGRGAQEEAQGSLFIPCDVTNTRIVKNAIEKAASFGEIRGVVSCAGIYTEGLLDNVTDEEMQKFFEVNVFGTINYSARCPVLTYAWREHCNGGFRCCHSGKCTVQLVQRDERGGYRFYPFIGT